MAAATYSKDERLRKQRERRARNGNKYTHTYERTKKGKLMRTYRNMQSRVQGVLRKKAHLYAGLPILPRQEFYDWALACEEFHTLYDAWVMSGYRCGDSPSVDRIDPEGGYIISNMRWVSHRENSRITRNRRSPFGAELHPLSYAA